MVKKTCRTCDNSKRLKSGFYCYAEDDKTKLPNWSLDKNKDDCYCWETPKSLTMLF